MEELRKPGAQEFLQRLTAARPRLAPKTRLQPDRVSGSTVLLYPEGVILLNTTGEAIVRLCDGTHSFAEILARLALTYSTSVEALERDVSVYLFKLHQQSLLELLEEGEYHE